MIRLLVVRYHPDRGRDLYVNVGVLAQDGKKILSKFCSNVDDLIACSNTDLSIIPMNTGEVFLKNLENPPSRLDYGTMEQVVIKPETQEYFDYLVSNSYASQVRYSDLFSFDIPLLSELVVDTLYDMFVKGQYLNPFSGAAWAKEMRGKVKKEEVDQRAPAAG